MTKNIPLQPRFADEKTVSAVFGIGTKQLRKMRMANTGPAFKKLSGTVGRPGGRVVYDLEAVESWVNSRPGGGEALDAHLEGA